MAYRRKRRRFGKKSAFKRGLKRQRKRSYKLSSYRNARGGIRL